MSSILLFLCVSWIGFAVSLVAPNSHGDTEHGSGSFLLEHGIPQLSDSDLQESQKMYTPFFKDGCSIVTDADFEYDAPEYFDWRDQNVVPPYEDVGYVYYNISYAFSAIGNIMSLYNIKYKEKLTLSAQQIIDCDKRNNGTEGGLVTNAFLYLIEHGGSESADDYPLTYNNFRCKFDKSKVRVKLAGCYSFHLTSQEKLKQLLYHFGPIAISIRSYVLKSYTRAGGIIRDKDCLYEHRFDYEAFLLVGYGSENGVPYWIVKNYLGKSWGENGYFRLQRGEGADSCGMMNTYMASAVIA